jgi:hypothetical protein
MSVSEGAASSALLYLDGPAHILLDGELVLFELSTGRKVIRGAMSAPDFLETFGRAADIAHRWSSSHYCSNGQGNSASGCCPAQPGPMPPD